MIIKVTVKKYLRDFAMAAILDLPFQHLAETSKTAILFATKRRFRSTEMSTFS